MGRVFIAECPTPGLSEGTGCLSGVVDLNQAVGICGGGLLHRLQRRLWDVVRRLARMISPSCGYDHRNEDKHNQEALHKICPAYCGSLFISLHLTVRFAPLPPYFLGVTILEYMQVMREHMEPSADSM